jgi:hypothetical protein
VTTLRRPVLAILLVGLALLAACGGPGQMRTMSASSEGRVPFGAFLGSDAAGVAAYPGFQAWLGADAVAPSVGHTYLPGNSWRDIEVPDPYVGPWSDWVAREPGRLLVLNVPMLTPNEPPLPDDAVRGLLAQGASGAFDNHFRILGERLVALGAAKVILIPGWEMNGTSYTHRCEPDPAAWKEYFRRIVTVMRSVPGQEFQFNFNSTRGTDAIPWTECYPGDDVVDMLGMDTYDQSPGRTFDDYVNQPLGLGAQVDFARAHDKPVSYPEWGLLRYGDRPEYVRAMLDWMESQDAVFQTITDYCPSGVYECAQNPESSQEYRSHYAPS